MTNGHLQLNEPAEMQEQLAAFASILRGLGVRVSTSEVLDSLNAVSHIDLSNPGEFKKALEATLIKRNADRRIFELAFHNFFVPPEQKKEMQVERLNAEEKRIHDEDEVEYEFTRSIYESGGQWAGGVPEHFNLTPEQKETLARMPSEYREKLQQRIEGFRGNTINDPSGLIARVIEASLNYWRYYLKKQEEINSREREKRKKDRNTGRDDVDSTIDKVEEQYRRDREVSLLEQDMKNIDDEDLTRLSVLVTQLSRNLATRVSRRYRQSSNRSKVDIRRTIRNNLAFGGVPVNLAYRSKRISRPRLVILCDVSASMSRYARFIIQFIYGLSHVVRDIETFIFSEELERITPYFDAYTDFSSTMARVMGESGQWGKTTNLNKALKYMEDNFRYVFTTDAYFFIVSDTKTQQPGEAARRVFNIRRKVKDLVWLNTLPLEEWEDIYTVSIFYEVSKMLECGTVNHLERAISKHLLQ